MTRLKETLKSILIVLLLLSSLFLLLLALPVNVVSRLPLPPYLAQMLGTDRETGAALSAPTSKIPAAATPLSISVHNSSGRHTVCRDAAALDAAYNALSGLLAQALTSAHDGAAFDGDWAGALEKTGVVFSFGGRIPLSALCRWLTDEASAAEDTARDYLLLVDGKNVMLLTSGTTPMQYKTTLSAAALDAALEPYTPDGSSFAAGHSAALHPMTLWESTVLLPVYSAENPISENFATTLATALDFNPYGAGTYTDPDGNTIFSETDRSLSVSADGKVTVTVSGGTLPRFTAAEDTPAAKIELVRSVLHTVTDGHLGDAVLQLTDYTSVSCGFTFVLDGVPVLPAACTAAFDGSRLSELTVTLRTYHKTTGQHRLMPMASAAAITERGTRLTAAYTLSGAPGWSTN